MESYFDQLPQELLTILLYYITDEIQIHGLFSLSPYLRELYMSQNFWKNALHSNITSPNINVSKLWITNYFDNLDPFKKYKVNSIEVNHEYAVMFRLNDNIFNSNFYIRPFDDDEDPDGVMSVVYLSSKDRKKKFVSHIMENKEIVGLEYHDSPLDIKYHKDVIKINKVLSTLYELKGETYAILESEHKCYSKKCFMYNDVCREGEDIQYVCNHRVNFEIDGIKVSVLYSPKFKT